MKSEIQNSKLKIGFCVLLTLSLIGCDAFVRKFTRKPKGPKVAPPMVLAPEEYKNLMSKEDIYRQYFVFWKSWQSELTASLEMHRSKKKKVDCANQAIINLGQMKNMLVEEKQAQLDKYIQQMQNIKKRVDNDDSGFNDLTLRDSVESIRLTVSRKFDYPSVKVALK